MTTMPRSARSYLFVPGHRPERFDKALAAGADAVIVDLEDAVPPADKARAREAIAAWVKPAHSIYVRINAAGTEWFEHDAALARMPGVAGIVLPKAERPADIEWLVGDADAKSVLPLIETAQGFVDARAVANQRAVQRLLFGSIDFQLDLRIGVDDAELSHFRSQLVLVSRLANVEPPVDGVTTSIDDAERIRADTHQARRLGFGGKLCIHPKQVPIVHGCFRPTEAEIEWARRVVDANALAQGGAATVDGKMIDRPVVQRAESILALAEV